VPSLRQYSGDVPWALVAAELAVDCAALGVVECNRRKSLVQNPDQPELAGEVHIDGAYFGGKVRQANRKEDRTDRRTTEERSGKRQVVVVAREVLGRILPFIVPHEAAVLRESASTSRAAQWFMPTSPAPRISCTRPIQ
jgi:hypothetical protein